MPIAAEKEGKKIAVEIKTFSGFSSMSNFYEAVGQYLIYKELVANKESDRVLYLAVPDEIYDEYFYPTHGREMREKLGIRLTIYNPIEEKILNWID